MKYEENPFETEDVAKEWIGSVEGEEGMFRDKIIYPLLRSWVKENNPETVLEIGSGQGVCSDKLGKNRGRYIGVEPSQHLTKRAKELYGDKDGREFVVGNAYDLPLANESVDAIFSVNVWFHLNNLDRGAEEVFRVLKKRGKFLIITANPDSYDTWQSFYDEPSVDEQAISGKVNTPVVPLSKNILYTHSLDKIKNSLQQADLKIKKIKELVGDDSVALFISIEGEK